jgi:hypothetical protein
MPAVRKNLDLPEACISHGESGRSRSVLGLDDLVTAELDP